MHHRYAGGAPQVCGRCTTGTREMHHRYSEIYHRYAGDVPQVRMRFNTGIHEIYHRYNEIYHRYNKIYHRYKKIYHRSAADFRHFSKVSTTTVHRLNSKKAV
jgi:hypothetical protein